MGPGAPRLTTVYGRIVIAGSCGIFLIHGLPYRAGPGHERFGPPVTRRAAAPDRRVHRAARRKGRRHGALI